jgi:RNA polymerase sigma factor (sigma-70 family)
VPFIEEEDERAPAHSAAYSTANVSTEPSPLEHYELTECAAHLSHTLECEITPEQRRLFELHHMDSMPIAEIARSMSKTEDAVKSNLYRTRKLLLAR